MYFADVVVQPALFHTVQVYQLRFLLLVALPVAGEGSDILVIAHTIVQTSVILNGLFCLSSFF